MFDDTKKNLLNFIEKNENLKFQKEIKIELREKIEKILILFKKYY